MNYMTTAPWRATRLKKPMSSAPRLLAPVLAVCVASTACSSLPKPDENYAATLPEEVPVTAKANGAIFQDQSAVTLFDDAVAHRVGDILTIVLQENTNATKSATTTTKKTTTEAMATPTLAGGSLTLHGRALLNNSLNDASSFDGEGNSSQSNQLTGSVTVTVAKRLANGNLLVRGQKWITINQGREFVRIQGIVRPVDISPSNTVPSYKVADASISYGSQGVIDAANSKSLLSRFFDSKWMPF
jgi:flagellar L-ring protein precursor FlgH